MPNEKKQKQANGAGGFGAGFVAATIIFLVILILAGAALGGWWYCKKYIKDKLYKEVGQTETQNVSGTETVSADTYMNTAFGFQLKMTPSWKNYKAKTETIGGDFEVGRVAFFLPTTQKKGWESPDMPGYFNPFVISAYVKYSWDNERSDSVMGEEIGRNNYYVFVWSHFNGDPPSDIPAATIREMQTIVDSIQVWDVGDSSSAGAPSGQTSVSPKATTPKNCSFPNGDIEYWWNTVSQDVRDCYISKYGYPIF